MTINSRQIEITITYAIKRFNVPEHLYIRARRPRDAAETRNVKGLATISDKFRLRADQERVLERSMLFCGISTGEMLKITDALQILGKRGETIASKIRGIWRTRDNMPITDKPFLDMMLECRIREVAHVLSSIVGAPMLEPKNVVQTGVMTALKH